MHILWKEQDRIKAGLHSVAAASLSAQGTKPSSQVAMRAPQVPVIGISRSTTLQFRSQVGFYMLNSPLRSGDPCESKMPLCEMWLPSWREERGQRERAKASRNPCPRGRREQGRTEKEKERKDLKEDGQGWLAHLLGQRIRNGHPGLAAHEVPAHP